jgi:hypothetical protein
MNRLILFTVLAVIVLSRTLSMAQEQNIDAWSQFSFLMGTWSGTGSGKPGEITAGSTSFSFDLDKNILVRKNRAECAPKPNEQSGFVHEDLMIIYHQPNDRQFHAIYFDNEGHIINYTVTPQTPKSQIIFESDAVQSAPRFLMVYELAADGALINEFQIAPPGGKFQTYTKGTINKIKQ